jgi:hypothetical protein
MTDRRPDDEDHAWLCFIRFYRKGARSVFHGEVLARMVREDLAHVTRGDREEVSLIDELDVRAREPQIDLGDQVRRIERMGRVLSSQVDHGKTPELLVHRGIDFMASHGSPPNSFHVVR